MRSFSSDIVGEDPLRQISGDDPCGEQENGRMIGYRTATRTDLGAFLGRHRGGRVGASDRGEEGGVSKEEGGEDDGEALVDSRVDGLCRAPDPSLSSQGIFERGCFREE